MIVDGAGNWSDVLLNFPHRGVHAALDVGCGAGVKTAQIAGHIKTTVGVDPDADQVCSARARFSGGGLYFGVGRAETLCFTAGSFDVVFFNESLHHVPVAHQVDALHESCRVLRPQGRVLIVEPIHGSGALGRTLKLYLGEKPQARSAAEAIASVLRRDFTLEDRSVIRVAYRFAGLEAFLDFLRASRPDEGAAQHRKRDIQARFDRCERDREGATIVDYDATVWQMVKT